VSAELLSLVGARPELGRTFFPGEDRPGGDGYVIVSHEVWEQRFLRDPAIIGRSIVLDGTTREVVGVMPADFRFPSSRTQVWIPLHCDPRNQTRFWAGDFMPVVGRLVPGATLEQARAEIRGFQARVPALFPWPMPPAWNADVSVIPLQSAIVGDVRPRLLMLLAVVGLVLLVACANVANLTLARAASRSREIGVRCALGAGQARIGRQLLTESLVLASIGGVLGLVVAVQGLAVLRKLLPRDTPRLDDVHLDWRVLAFTAVVVVATGLAFGVAPALQAARTDVAEAMKSGGRNAAAAVPQRLRSVLVVAEIAFAVLLVTAAGLFVRSFWSLTHVNAGFQPNRVVTARITPGPGFCEPAARCLAFYRALLDRMSASPGVSVASLVNTLPLDGRVAKRSLNVAGSSAVAREDAPLFWLNVVTPEYFRVMSVPLVAGRAFTDADLSGSPPVAIVPVTTARRFWPGESAIGKRVRFVGDTDWQTIVGVVGDVRAHTLRQDMPSWMEGVVYVPESSKATLEDGRIPPEMTIAMRTSADVAHVEAALDTAVWALSRDVPVSDVRTMESTVSDAVASPASMTMLVTGFASVALALGVVGIYGVLSFLVSRRTREIGIRMALGARRTEVFRSIMKEGAQLAAAGIALGLASAALATRAIAGELYGVAAVDPATYAGVAVVVILATLGACAVPTYRATRVDALTALRQD
jgi:predicted permease